jgi:hypothetical protein
MAVRYIQSAELLVLADDLAGRGRGPGKPRTIYLRRSISTAYYAIFHMITQHTAMRLLGPGWTTKHASVARWATHTDLAALADAANGRGNQALVRALDRVDPRLADIAQNFVDLQAARHGADYNDFFPVSKAATLSYVDAARSAVTSAKALHASSEASYMRFPGLAVGGVKIAKTR